MRTPIQAMIWELWRTSCVEWLFRIGAQCGLVVWLHWFAKNLGSGKTHEQHVIQGLMIMMLAMTCLFSMTWLNHLDNSRKGFSFRLGFTRPVSTVKLVVVPMMFVTASAVICFLVPAALLGWLWGSSIHLLSLSTGIACLVTCFVASAWAPTTILGRWVGMAIVAMGFLAGMSVFHVQRSDSEPFFLAIGQPGYFEFAWYHYVACSIAAILAVFVTISGVERQRHGEAWRLDMPWTAVLTKLGKRFDTLVSPRQQFASKFRAQCWYEMRRFGYIVLLLGVLAPFFPLFFSILATWVEPNWQGTPVAWILALAICPFVYQLVGAEGSLGLRRKQGATYLSPFDATRAAQNGQLIATKLFIIAACAAAGWLWMGVTAGLYSTLAGKWADWGRIGEVLPNVMENVPGRWRVAAIPTAILVYASSSSASLALGLWLALYPRRIMCGFVVLALHVPLVFWDARQDWALQGLWTAYGYLLAAAILGGGLYIIWKAVSSGYLGSRLFGGACCLWLVYVSTTVAVYVEFVPLNLFPPVVIFLGMSSLLVPLAALALAPLALAAHRHA